MCLSLFKRSLGLAIIGGLYIWSCVSCLYAEPIVWQAPISPQLRKSFWLGEGEWEFRAGELEQKSPQRLCAAILKEPAFSDTRLSVEFRVHPEGPGVRAAALILRATGTLTYYWIHLDTKNHNVIITRSTPQNPWIELRRARCLRLTEDIWHQIVAEIKGDEIVVILDGEEIIRAQDTEQALKGGRVGLGTSQGRVTFRHLKIEGERITMNEPLKQESPPYKIISQGAAAGPYQAFPDACRLPNGDIMCVFYAGYGHVSLPNEAWPQGGRICYVRSSDEGRTWSAPQILYDDAQDNRDPHIAALSNGQLICSFFNYWQDKGKIRYRSLIVRSFDGGQTWEHNAQPVTPEMWACSAPVRQMPDGTLILGVYTEAGSYSYGGVVRSTDGGQTWSEPIPIGREAQLPLDAETDVILLRDGTLYAALRSSKINMHYAMSRDLGLTWSPVYDIGFPGHAPHFTRLSTGEILLTHRVPQTALHISRDEAKTWQGPYILDHVIGAYPATVELKDGSILAVYYEEGEGSAIRALRFKLVPEGIQILGWD